MLHFRVKPQTDLTRIVFHRVRPCRTTRAGSPSDFKPLAILSILTNSKARALANSDGARSVVSGRAAKSEDGFEEFSWFYSKGVSQRDDVQQRDVSLTAFDAAYIVAMEVRQFCKLFLREAAPQSKLTDTPSEHDSRVGFPHPAIIRP
jgi:hypothetical protein